MEPSVIITPDTPEKYRPLAAEIVPPLLALLRERSALEEEIYQRYCTLKEAFWLEGDSSTTTPTKPPGTLTTIYRGGSLPVQFAFDADYTPEEWDFIRRHNCKILHEITLRRGAFTEVPRRMIEYSGTILGEVFDEGQWWWAVLSKNRRGKWVFSTFYSDLPSVAEGL